MPLTSERDVDLAAHLVSTIPGAWQSDRTCQKGELLFACMPMVLEVLSGSGQDDELRIIALHAVTGLTFAQASVAYWEAAAVVCTESTL